MTALASTIHAEADAGWWGEASRLWVLFPDSGDNCSPETGPGSWGSTGSLRPTKCTPRITVTATHTASSAAPATR